MVCRISCSRPLITSEVTIPDKYPITGEKQNENKIKNKIKNNQPSNQQIGITMKYGQLIKILQTGFVGIYLTLTLAGCSTDTDSAPAPEETPQTTMEPAPQQPATPENQVVLQPVESTVPSAASVTPVGSEITVASESTVPSAASEPEKKEHFLSNDMEVLKMAKEVQGVLDEDAEEKKAAVKDAAN